MEETNPHRDVDALWREFRCSKSEHLRNELLENYLPVVRFNAERIGARLPQEVDGDDLVSAGVFGLMDAIDGYDLERGVKFETYCAQRIRGAILDALRNQDWVPRLVRTRAGRIEHAQAELQSSLGRAPTTDELADRLGLSPRQFEKLSREASPLQQFSLSQAMDEPPSGRDAREIGTLEDRRGNDPVRETQRRELRALLARGLNRTERLILALYYYEEMTMKEIGEVLDLSESRVSQMRASIIARLREHAARQAREFA
jgi:RNA polymerase sigma factor for flagellar operon FliA